MLYAAPGRVGRSGVAVIEASRNVGYRSPITSRSGGGVTERRHKMTIDCKDVRLRTFPGKWVLTPRIPPLRVQSHLQTWLINFGEIRSTWNVPRRICGRLEYLYQSHFQVETIQQFRNPHESLCIFEASY